MPPINLLIKPASSACELKCAYCFYRDEAEKREKYFYGIMSEQTLENVIKKALEFASGECSFAYQGGEPTLAGLDFFKKSVALQKKHNQKHLKINNSIQTNGIGLDEAWTIFFRENNFLVGISLDGTKETHDAFRKTPEGGGSFKEVMKAIGLLKKHGVEFNILTVVNAQTARHIQRIYDFYAREGFRYLQFIACLPPLGEESCTAPYALTPKLYGIFLKTLFDLWYRDYVSGVAPHIRQFENYIEMLLSYPPESCAMSGRCSMQNVVEADGGVYPCDFYANEALCLGNLNTESFEMINRKRAETGFIEESAQPAEECLACDLFFICRGGCKRYREPKRNGGYGVNMFCDSYREFFPYALERMKKLAEYSALR